MLLPCISVLRWWTWFMIDMFILNSMYLFFSCMSNCLSVHWRASLHTPLHPHMSIQTTPCTSVNPPNVHMSFIHPGDSWVSHLYICLSGISVSVSTSSCWLVHPLFVCQQLYNCGPIIPVEQHHCWSLAVSCMAGFGTYIFWVLFLLMCFLDWRPTDVCSGYMM